MRDLGGAVWKQLSLLTLTQPRCKNVVPRMAKLWTDSFVMLLKAQTGTYMSDTAAARPPTNLKQLHDGADLMALALLGPQPGLAGVSLLASEAPRAIYAVTVPQRIRGFGPSSAPHALNFSLRAFFSFVIAIFIYCSHYSLHFRCDQSPDSVT